LIRAARELLEVLPPGKVTRAAVARHAKVDPNLIRYYFQDRDSLLLAVIDQIVAERRHPDIVEEQQRGPAPERLRKRVRGFLEFNATYPFFHRLMLDEVVHWKSARARQTVHGLNTGAIAEYADILKAGAKERSLRRVDPVLLHLAIIGMSEFFLNSRPLLEDALGKGATPADFAQRYADMIVELVTDGVRTR
jgi:AcrR family transcriptional regulator